MTIISDKQEDQQERLGLLLVETMAKFVEDEGGDVSVGLAMDTLMGLLIITGK